MNWSKTVDRQARRLLLIFAGWGSGPEPLAGVGVPGYDTIVVWDYTDDSAEGLPLEGYEEIVMVGWSFGVYMGARFIARHHELPVTLRIAVNGTLNPVHPELGIPPAIFEGTLNGLNEASLRKFTRRMLGSAMAMANYSAPERTIENLRDELARIREVYAAEGAAPDVYDKAVISDADMIIPSANQQRQWAAKECIAVEGPHFPDFKSLLERLVIDKERVGRRFCRCAPTYEANATTQREIALRLVSKAPCGFNPREVLELGSGTGMMTRAFLSRYHDVRLMLLLDLQPAYESPFFGQPCFAVEQCDAEARMMQLEKETFDAVISGSTIQWFNSPARFFLNLARVLRPGGLALISTFGPDTYRQLEGIAPRLELPSLPSLRAMIPDELEVLDASEEQIEMGFDTPLDVLRHMKLTGVNALGSAKRISPWSLMRSYPRQADGTCLLTYHPLYLVMRRRP